jgi:integrase
VQGIRRQDVALRLGEIAGTNGPFAANRARAALSAFFSWALGEGLVESNPVVGTNKATAEISRDRVLTDDELRAIWQGVGDGDYGRIILLLILTGQRREEVGGMLWQELRLSEGMWSIGPERTKNGLPHDVPLSHPALDILSGIEPTEGREFVFGSGPGPFQGWSNAKAALDKKIALQPWRLHDIRRTVATRMADLGVLPHIIESILNHVSGHKAGVAGIYNRSVYAAEKRAAMNLWANHVSNGQSLGIKRGTEI